MFDGGGGGTPPPYRYREDEVGLLGSGYFGILYVSVELGIGIWDCEVGDFC